MDSTEPYSVLDKILLRRSCCSFVFVFLFVVEFVFLVAVFVFLVAVFVLLPLSHCCRAFPQYCTVHAGLIVFKQSLIIKQ